MTTGLRIVIADDEPEMRDFLARVLPRLGHEVVAAAADGQALVEQCRLHRPDLVLTDLKMPLLDGIEASHRIYDERPVPIIIVSAFHNPELVSRAEVDHVMAYLVKPIGAADLQPAIATAARRFADLNAPHERT